MNIKVLFQDEHFVIVSKPSGMLVHPYWKESNERECLLKYVRDQLKQYLYPFHRLDRATSGIVIFGLSKESTKKIQDIWHNEETEKYYKLLARGVFESSGIFEFTLQNEKKVKQDAKTQFWPLLFDDNVTYLSARIFTGRKHQIRRHFARTAHHLIGDTTYGKGNINRYYRENYKLNRLFLHCSDINFIHPYTNQRINIHDPLPSELESVLTKLNLKEF